MSAKAALRDMLSVRETSASTGMKRTLMPFQPLHGGVAETPAISNITTPTSEWSGERRQTPM